MEAMVCFFGMSGLIMLDVPRRGQQEARILLGPRRNDFVP